MHDRNSLFGAILISVSVFCIVAVFSMFGYLKNKESGFNKEKALLIKEGLDLRDSMESLQEEIIQKIETLALLEEENERLNKEYVEKFEILKEENTVLAERINEIEGKPMVDRLRDALRKEKNENVKKFLE